MNFILPVLQFLWKHKSQIPTLVFGVGAVYFYEQAQAARRETRIAVDAAVVEKALADGAIQGLKVSQAKIVADLSAGNAKLIADLQIIDKRLKLAESIIVKATGHVVSPSIKFATAKTSGPVTTFHSTNGSGADLNVQGEWSWTELHHRAIFSLPKAEFTLSQKYMVNGVILTTPAGDGKLLNVDLHEYDPVTGEEIETAVQLETKFEFTTEALQKTTASMFHLRGVGGFGTQGFAGGIQFFNLERFKVPFFNKLNLGVFVSYNPKEPKIGQSRSKWGAPLFLGYRLFNSNVSVGPTYDFFRGQHWGGVALIEINR